MRPYLSVAAVFGALLAASAAAAQSREFTRTVELRPGGTLRVEGNKGSMRITSWDQPRVDIRARIEPPEGVTADYAARAVEAAAVDVVGDGSSVTVRSNYENVPLRDGTGDWGSRTVPPIHYEIRAPRRLRLSVDSDRGPAAVRGFQGDVDIVIDRGELDVADIDGEVRLEIDRGNQSRLSGIRGRLVVEADRTELRIESLALDADSRVEIDRGEIELVVPATQKLTIRTDISRRGEFRSDLPIEWSSENRRRAQGLLNGGGPGLLVESDRARVELRRK